MSPTRSVAITLAAAALLAACSSDPQPKFEDPTPSPSASSTSASPVAESSSPAVNSSPEDAVRDWVAAYDQALLNGDTSDVESLSADDCSSCEDAIEPISDVFAKGGHFETAGWTVVAAKVKAESASRSTVNAGIRYEAGQTVPEAGADPVQFQVENHIVIFRLLRTGDAWAVSFIGYLS